MINREKKLKAFERALDVMDRLRAECPWNHAQTIDTLRPMTVEEVYEPPFFSLITTATLGTVPYIGIPATKKYIIIKWYKTKHKIFNLINIKQLP